MGRTVFLLILLFGTVGGISSVNAKSWRGIVPTHSTRSDVERILGTPTTVTQYNSTYKTRDETVFVIYSIGPPCGSNGVNGWQVPKDTVLEVNVSPSKRPRLSSLKLNLKDFRELQIGDVQGPISYMLNKKDGLEIDIEDDKVKSVVYLPSIEDEPLRCPGNKPLGVWDYSSTLNSDEKEQIDKFMLRLHEDPSLKGTIVASSEHRRVDQAPLLVDVVKYLESKYEKDLDRIYVYETYRPTGRLEFRIRKEEKLIPYP